MEFGWINLFGGVIVVLILIPNIIYALKKRDDQENAKIPKILLVCEQVGRYGCMILMWLPLLVWKFGFASAEEFIAYLLLNGGLILAYWLIWLVYAKKATLKTGMALAIIPAVIFLISGVLLRHWLLTAAAVLFGIAHIKITYFTHCNLENK